MRKFVVLVGLPGSGKSTVAKKYAKEGYAICSTDAIRKELFGNEEYQDGNAEVFQTVKERLRESLQKGNVIYDATNVTARNRKGILRDIKGIPCEKTVVVVSTPYEECVKRNAKRSRVVPEEVIRRMHERFQMPGKEEGWDEIVEVRE